jgi:hypothetical protein
LTPKGGNPEGELKAEYFGHHAFASSIVDIVEKVTEDDERLAPRHQMTYRLMVAVKVADNEH